MKKRGAVKCTAAGGRAGGRCPNDAVRLYTVTAFMGATGTARVTELARCDLHPMEVPSSPIVGPAIKFSARDAFTREAFLRAAALAGPGEKIPVYVLLALESQNGVWAAPITEEDIAWGTRIAETLNLSPATPSGEVPSSVTSINTND